MHCSVEIKPVPKDFHSSGSPSALLHQLARRVVSPLPNAEQTAYKGGHAVQRDQLGLMHDFRNPALLWTPRVEPVKGIRPTELLTKEIIPAFR